jgi:hypothetical protein
MVGIATSRGMRPQIRDAAVPRLYVDFIATAKCDCQTDLLFSQSNLSCSPPGKTTVAVIGSKKALRGPATSGVPPDVANYSPRILKRRLKITVLPSVPCRTLAGGDKRMRFSRRTPATRFFVGGVSARSESA